MPIQKTTDEFILFRYDAPYVFYEPEKITDRTPLLNSLQLNPSICELTLDGGNLVNWEDSIIMTERVFKDNSDLKRNVVVNTLEKVFDAKVHFVKDVLSDMTGHIDGHLRFINQNTLLVNSLANEVKCWRNSFLQMVDKTGYSYIEMPWFERKVKGNSHHAIGCYVNYLEISNIIIFPIFEIDGNNDKEALQIIEEAFPDRIIEPININEIALRGGLMNCISWQVEL
ncbi:MAG: agmatine deiminase family protein [Cyclobacteriaceae bacterium]